MDTEDTERVLGWLREMDDVTRLCFDAGDVIQNGGRFAAAAFARRPPLDLLATVIPIHPAHAAAPEEAAETLALLEDAERRAGRGEEE